MTRQQPPSENAEPTLRLRGVGRRFGGLLAVRDVDLDVAHGERRAILGPNGAGKTTLFNVISGDLPPSAGTVELFGQDVTRLPRRKRARLGLARTYQQSRMLLGRDASRTASTSRSLGVGGGHLRPVTLPPERRGAPRAGARGGQAGSAIDHKLSELVGDLSHGEHRQVAIAMALASEPKLLMLDEPASGLSRGERQLLTELLLGLDPGHHPHPDRARHGRRAHGRRAGDDDAQRPRDRRGHAGRDPRQRRSSTISTWAGTTNAMSDVHSPSSRRSQGQGLTLLRSAQVLHDVTFSMGKESVAIVGRNGMGKTTLCNAIMGFTPPRASGSVRFDGRS